MHRPPFIAAAFASVWMAAAAQGADPYVEVGDRIGLDFVHVNGASGELFLAEIMGAGGALLDYDGDGDLDLYLVQGGVLDGSTPGEHRDRLYRNDLSVAADGSTEVRLVDVTERSGVAAMGYGMGVATGDIDNDGWVDLYLTNRGQNQLWRNNGDGSFDEITAEAGADDPRWSVAASFADFDGDGWLDLYVGNYVDWSVAIHKTCAAESGAPDYCSPQSFKAEPDLLLVNRGGEFEDVTRSAGLSAQYGPALGSVSDDFNGDGRLDLFVANDGEANQLWINQGDRVFVDQAVLAGVAVNAEGWPEASMGTVAEDVDGDGDVDLFLTHLERETNTLYLNNGSGLFEDRSRASGVGMASWLSTGFGTALVDFDSDGHRDLVAVNGAVTIIEGQLTQDGPPLRQRNQLFRGGADGKFEEVTAQAVAAFERLEVSRGLAVGDVDSDGDADLLITNNAGPPRLLANVQAANRPWLGLRVLGPGGRDALGAQVTLEAGGRRLLRRVRTDGSYASASDPRSLINDPNVVGASPDVVVRWPEGGARRWHDLPPGRYVTLPWASP